MRIRISSRVLGPGLSIRQDYRFFIFRFHGVMLHLLDVHLQQGVDVERRRLQDGSPLSSDTTLTYPVAKIDGFDVHLERNFFGIKKKELSSKHTYVAQNITFDQLPANASYAQLLSNIDFVKVCVHF